MVLKHDVGQAWLERNEKLAEKYDPNSTKISRLLLPADDLCRQGMETQVGAVVRRTVGKNAVRALGKNAR